MARVLVVDDEPGLRSTLETLLSGDGYEVVVAGDGYLALDLLTQREFDVVLTDAVTPNLSGDDLLTTLRERAVDVEVILMATDPDVTSTINAIHAGAFDYLTKPVQRDQVCQSVASALKRRSLKQENRQRLEDSKRYTHELEAIVNEKSRKLKESEERLAVLVRESSRPRAPLAAPAQTEEPKASAASPLAAERELQMQLSQAQRFDTLGRLACGVAHDLNNLLTVIFASSSLAREALADNRNIVPDLNNIDAAGERAAALTRQLLAFSRRRAPQPKVQSLNDLVNGTTKMIDRLLGEDIQLETALAENLGLVCVDAGQLEQIVANLAVIVRSALPCGGSLLVSTEATVGGQLDVEPALELTTPHVKLSLRGRAENVNHEVFRGLAVENAAAEASGFGVESVRALVKQNAGWLGFSTSRSGPVEICVFLPVAMRASAVHPSGGETPQARVAGETILVVEGNDPVRSLLGRILKEHGYSVIEARSPAEALAADRTQKISLLLLSDAALPSAGSARVVETLTRENPQLKTLLMSGGSGATLGGLPPTPAGFAVLHKPFGAIALTTRVRELLDGKGQTSPPGLSQ